MLSGSCFKVVAMTVFVLGLSGCQIWLSEDLKEEVTKMEAAQALWNQKNTGSYQYTKSYFCFCEATSIEIFVENNAVTQIIDTTNGNMVSLSAADTINDLFLWIDTQLSEIPYPYQFEVSYDPVNGYPLTIYKDTDENTQDDETMITISNFSF